MQILFDRKNTLSQYMPPSRAALLLIDRYKLRQNAAPVASITDRLGADGRGF